MNPQVEFNSEENDNLTFTLSGINVSFANAIRRTILSDIPVVVFKTAPYEENRATIYKNTTRLNNEIIKQHSKKRFSTFCSYFGSDNIR